MGRRLARSSKKINTEYLLRSIPYMSTHSLMVILLINKNSNNFVKL